MVLLNGSAGPSRCTGSWRSPTSGRGCGRCSRRTYCGAPAAWPWAEPTRCSRTYTRPSPGTVIDCPRPIRGTTRVRCPAKGSSSCRAPWPGPPCGDGRAVPAGDHLSRSRHRDPLGDRTTPVIAGAHRSARTNPRPPTQCPRRTELDQRTRQAPRCHTRSGQHTCPCSDRAAWSAEPASEDPCSIAAPSGANPGRSRLVVTSVSSSGVGPSLVVIEVYGRRRSRGRLSVHCVRPAAGQRTKRCHRGEHPAYGLTGPRRRPTETPDELTFLTTSRR